MTATTLRAEWSVAWASGTLRADCKVGGSVVATDQMRTAGSAAHVALSADRTTINADGKDLVFITGDIQDANGAIVPSAESSVSFSVSGPGQLVGVDNGNPVDTTSYKGTSRKAFSGKVLANRPWNRHGREHHGHGQLVRADGGSADRHRPLIARAVPSRRAVRAAKPVAALRVSLESLSFVARGDWVPRRREFSYKLASLPAHLHRGTLIDFLTAGNQ